MVLPGELVKINWLSLVLVQFLKIIVQTFWFYTCPVWLTYRFLYFPRFCMGKTPILNDSSIAWALQTQVCEAALTSRPPVCDELYSSPNLFHCRISYGLRHRSFSLNRLFCDLTATASLLRPLPCAKPCAESSVYVLSALPNSFLRSVDMPILWIKKGKPREAGDLPQAS